MCLNTLPIVVLRICGLNQSMVSGRVPSGFTLIFALTFCPGSAALFFGSFIPLAVKYESGILLPSLFGAGTALPVVVFAILIAAGTRAVGRAFDRITQFEWWARRVTGTIFIGVGVYFSLAYVFRVL